MHLFYTPDIQSQHRAFILNEEESKHAIRVLRMEAGHQLHLVDGRGGHYTAVITDAHPKRTVLEIVNVSNGHGVRPYFLHVAIAPTKNVDRLEWFLEKATEIGIDEITPIICDHSERKEVKVERLNKVIVAAMKQSLKAYLPKLNQPVKFDDFIGSATEGQRFIAHCSAGDKSYLSDLLPPSEAVLVLIGPEGDFSQREIDAALRQGFAGITFGGARLRTETAALTACIETNLLNRLGV